MTASDDIVRQMLENELRPQTFETPEEAADAGYEVPAFYIAPADAPAPSREQLQTAVEVAARLGVTPRTVRNLLKSGELPSYAIGAARRIDPSDVDNYLARHRDE